MPRTLGPIPPGMVLEGVSRSGSSASASSRRNDTVKDARPPMCCGSVRRHRAPGGASRLVAALVRAEAGDHAVRGAGRASPWSSHAGPADTADPAPSRPHRRVRRLERSEPAHAVRSAGRCRCHVDRRTDEYVRAVTGPFSSRRRTEASEAFVVEPSRSNATNDAGVSLASSSTATRPGGCAAAARRSRARSPAATTISPSTTHGSGSCARSALDELGEVAGQRPLVAAAQLHLVAVAEDDAAEAVPLRLEDERRRRRAASARPWPASA